MITIAAFVGGLFLGWALSLAFDPRFQVHKPTSDRDHADRVHEAAGDFNLALHDARAAGLNPSFSVAPIDPDLAPDSRPLIAGVARDNVAIRRTLRAPLNPPDLGCTLPPPGWYCSLAPGHKGACPTRPA